MASNSCPELRSIVRLNRAIVTALSNDPLGVADDLLERELIASEVHSRVLHYNGTPYEKASFLVEAMRNTIKTDPSKFSVFLEVLSEQTCTKAVVEKIRDEFITCQSELLVATELFASIFL